MQVYKHFSRRGMDYGRYFQGITSAAIGDHDIWGKIALPAICSDSKNCIKNNTGDGEGRIQGEKESRTDGDEGGGRY